MYPTHSELYVSLPSQRGYPVHFRSLDEVPSLLTKANLRKGRCLVVSDSNVAPLYGSPLLKALQQEGWEPKLHVIQPGEGSKTYSPLHSIFDTALRWGIDRQTPLLALGGGVVGDLAGFAAATLLRGLPLIQLPTTLIAQVDSAIGGKTGINHPVGKNLLGAFYQPHFVCADLTTVHTLPSREWASGLAEAIKHALINDAALFQRFESSMDAFLARDEDVITELIPQAATVKCHIVSQDERERGVRAWLNFGHTFGHAIERVAGYGTFTHGEAVALGMRAALHLSHQLHPTLPYHRLDSLVQQIPISRPFIGFHPEELLEAMYADKKVDAGALRLVLLRNLADTYVARDTPLDLIREAWTFISE